MPNLAALSVSSKKALFISPHEKSLLDEALSLLTRENPDSIEAELVRQRFDCLRLFGEAIALYPPIRESQTLRGFVRNEQQLIKKLAGLAPSSHLLRIPARIQAVRSFLVTKFHAFSLLCKLLKNETKLHNDVEGVLYSIMFTMMAEDVYFSSLDDPTVREEIKFRLADELVSLWDSGAEPAMIQHFPFLEALWIARNDSPPSFGTLDGTSEIFRLSYDLERDWHDFILNQLGREETKWALDEFLFGLSYEELLAVRTRLKRFGIAAVGLSEIRTFLGSSPAYVWIDKSDPRLLYDFYIDRKDTAGMRKRLDQPGPRKTLEEIYLKFRMTL